MAVMLRGDNRTLFNGAPYTFLVENVSSGVGSVLLANTTGVTAGVFIWLGEAGAEDAEIFRVGTVNTTSGSIQILSADGNGTTTRFAHAESTKVTVIPFNQIRFYWTAALGTIADETPTFNSSTPLTGYTDLTPDSLYTTYSDTGHTTGFGWFLFYNSISTAVSSTSNPIPYAGFSPNTVAEIFKNFDSVLNVREIKLVGIGEKFSWLNEALAVLKNKLNLSNVEYSVSTEQTLSVVSGTAEYLLPADFSDIVYINDGTSSRRLVPFRSVQKIGNYIGILPNYYLRNRYIGFSPTPDQDATYYYRYRAKAVRVTSLSDYVDLPNDLFYSLTDWLLYRASQKFQNGQAALFYGAFTNSVNLGIQAANKRDSSLEVFLPAPEANV